MTTGKLSSKAATPMAVLARVPASPRRGDDELGGRVDDGGGLGGTGIYGPNA
jgi:hypothetical protein